MSLYRKALAKNKDNKQPYAKLDDEDAPRRTSIGLKKRPSPSNSAQINKSPKKEPLAIRDRRQSGDAEVEDDPSQLEQEMSLMSVETAAPPGSPDRRHNALFSDGRLGNYRIRLRNALDEEEKDRIRQALHDELDELLEDA